mmetsp:Transcript_1866/g.2005  ORF Transcript_1866/g.2005 Transcript_1866/m.2005 type:complete len:122 (-) Transcript_1866:119-484(-)
MIGDTDTDTHTDTETDTTATAKKEFNTCSSAIATVSEESVQSFHTSDTDTDTTETAKKVINTVTATTNNVISSYKEITMIHIKNGLAINIILRRAFSPRFSSRVFSLSRAEKKGRRDSIFF